MKKFDKSEAKAYLLGLVATIMTINSTVVLIKNSYKLSSISQEEQVSVQEFYNKLVRNIIDFTNRKHVSLDSFSNGFSITTKDSATEISFVQNQVFISTLYVDGFREDYFLDLPTVSMNSLDNYISHVIREEVEEEELSLIDRSIIFIEDYMKDRDLSLEQMDEIKSIVEQLIILYSNFDNLTYSDKEIFIRNMFKVSEDEFDIVVPVIIREGNYVDCPAVSVNVLNRMFSYAWTKQAITRKGLDKTYNEVTVYDLISSKGQYQVFDEKTYLYAYGDKTSDAYKAIIDTFFACLMGDETIYHFHDNVEFVAPTLTPNGNYTPVQFVKNGNKHYRHQKDSDRIPIEDSILRYYFEVYKLLDVEGFLQEARESSKDNTLSLSFN